MMAGQMAINQPARAAGPARRGVLPPWAVKNPLVVVGGLCLAVVVAALAFGPLFVVDPMEQNLRATLVAPSARYLAGTDNLGRDVLSRVLYGGRYSLGISTLSLLVATLVGSLLGMLSGLQRSALTRAIDGAVDFLLAFPTMVLGILAAALLGNTLVSLVGAIGIALTPRVALVVRSRTLSIAGMGYVESAQVLGATRARLILRHVLPNVAGSILVIVTLYFPWVIALEASLSYLGLGVAADVATWGRVIADGQAVFVVAPWVSTAPGIMMVLTSLAFNLLGDGLRDVLDPKLQTRQG
jgi:peptide/nickel transport system permease protein